MNNIKILDCTLRDGGYLNDWDFGKSNIDLIINGLDKSGVDYIECGFLTEKIEYCSEKSLYKDLNKDFNFYGEKYALMVNFGEYDFSKSIDKISDIELRIAFKPFQTGEIFDCVSPLVENKIPFSLNPMHISLYDKNDLIRLCDLANKVYPTCFTAVDTMGVMDEEDVKRIFLTIDEHLNPSIAIGFHSHDNLGLSFENTKRLLSLGLERKIIIDTSLSGISRGGGMLSTGDIAKYLNSAYGTSYDLKIIDEVSKAVILPLINEHGIKDKIPYNISAKLGCHPNYAKFLSDYGCSYDDMKYFMSRIPDELKPYYNQKEIANIVKL